MARALAQLFKVVAASSGFLKRHDMALYPDRELLDVRNWARVPVRMANTLWKTLKPDKRVPAVPVLTERAATTGESLWLPTRFDSNAVQGLDAADQFSCRNGVSEARNSYFRLASSPDPL